MTKFTWSGAQDTNWFNANNWVPAIVPGAGVEVVIPAGLANYPIIGDSGSVSLNASMIDAGSLTLNSTGDNTDLIINGGGTFTLSGGGSIVMGDNANNRIYSNQSGTVLDNINDTIQGAGQIFAQYGLSIINEAAGVINARGVNNSLRVSNLAITNKGLVESTATGGLVLTSDTIDQSGGGTLSAAGGNVYLNATTVIGGTLKTAGGALIETSGDGSLLNGAGTLPVSITAGSTVQVNDANNLSLVGVINDAGAISLTSGQNGVNFDNTDLLIAGPGTVTLQGGGAIKLSDSYANRIYSNQSGAVLDNINDTIQGAGQIFAQYGLSIINEASGVIDASAAINGLDIFNIGVTNKGLVESTSTGSLVLGSMTLDQSAGGTLSAAGGNVYFNNSIIDGGTLTTTAAALIETDGNGAELNGGGTLPITVTAGSTVQVNDANNLSIFGVIDDAGTITLASGQNGVNFDNTDLLIAGGGVDKLQGGGALQLSDSGANRIYSNSAPTTLENVDDKIAGAGQIFSNGYLTVQNDAKGVINANAVNNLLNINNITVTNNGLLESTSTGGLLLGSMTLNQSGGGTLSAAGGNVYINNSTLDGGTLTTSGASLIETNGTGTALNGTSGNAVTITAGSTVQVNDSHNLTLVGVIDDVGTILSDSGENGSNFDNTDLLITGGGTVQLTGGGVVKLSDSANNRIYANQSGTTLENVDDSITGAGQIYSGNGLTLQNDSAGLINANATNNALNINTITVNNAGLVESTSTGGLLLGSMTLNNSGTLKAAGGNVYINNDVINGGTLTTTGASEIYTNGTGALLSGVANALTISSGSTVSITDATNLSLNGTINNVGTIVLNSGQNGANFDNTDLLIYGGSTVTLTGGGTVKMVTGANNRIFSNNASTILDNINNKIVGSGQIFSNGNLTITNEVGGTIGAANTGQTLSIGSITINNKGLVNSKADGVLTLNSMTLAQSGAGVLSATQGNIYFNSSTISGGAISTSGSYVVATNGGGTLLSGAASTLSIAAGSTVFVSDATNLSLTGTISNAGTIFLDSGQNGANFDNTDLLVSGAVNLTGGGTLLLSNSGNNRIYSNTGGSVLTNTSDTIVGAGQIFSNGNLSITNATGGTIEAGQGETLNVSLSLANSGVLEGNGGSLIDSGAVTGSGTAMVANGGYVGFTSLSTSIATVAYAGPQAGTVQFLTNSLTPVITGFAAGDAFEAFFAQNITSLAFVENTGSASGVLTFYSGQTAIKSYTLDGYYTTQDFQLTGADVSNNGNYFGVIGVGDVWFGGSGTWNTPADWSQGLPGADDDVVINAGSPTVSAPIGTVRSLSLTSAASLNFGAVTGDTVTGSIYDAGKLTLDNVAGQGGAALTAGSLDVTPSGGVEIGNATLSADDSLTVGSLVNSGAIALTGAANKQALLDVTGAAGFGAAGAILGAVALTGDSAIEFASGGIKQISANASLTETGAGAFLEIAGQLGGNSALLGLTNVMGSLSLESGAVIAPTGAVYDSGAIKVDDVSGAGGTILTLPTLYVSGALVIGNSAMTVADKVTVTSFRSTGSITLAGGASAQALLYVTSGATFDDIAGRLYGTVSLSGTSALQFASGAITYIAANAALRLQGKTAFVETGASLNTDSALTALSTVTGTLSLENGASFADNVALVDSGSLSLDGLPAEGGSALTLKGLTDTGALSIGDSTLSANSTVAATSLSSTGSITLAGSASFQALLNVSAPAGFGTAGSITGSVVETGKSAIEFASGSLSIIATGASLSLTGGSAFVEVAGTLGSNSALRTLATNQGVLTLNTGETIASSNAILNNGVISLDAAAGAGASQLTSVKGLTNTGTINLGDSTLANADLVSFQSLANSGAINIVGGAATQALFNVGGPAGFGTAGVLTGNVALAGDAAIKFTTGTISTIAAGSTLTINGPSAFVENAAALGANSALTTLANDSGTLSLHNSVKIASTNGLAIPTFAYVYIDTNGGEGGSNVTFAGRLSNSFSLNLGNSSLSQDDLLQAGSLSNAGAITIAGSSANQALLDITSAAAFGTGSLVTGSVSLAGDTAIEFTTGTLTGVAANSTLMLNDSNAYIENSGSLGSNSALDGFASNAGIFDLFNGAAVASTSAINNTGLLQLSTNSGTGLNTNLSTTLGLTNSGTLSLLTSTGVQANVTVTAATLNNSGTITLGGNASPNQTLLDITTGTAGFGTAGVLTGTVSVGAQAAIEFFTGSITRIAAGASLELMANTSYLEDSNGLGANSALSGLTSISGTLKVDGGSLIASNVAIVNAGVITMTGAGATLSTTGKLNNQGVINLGGAFAYAQGVSISAASLANTGTINLTSLGAAASLNIGGAANFGAASVFSGAANLIGDADIAFTSGAITSTAANSLLHLSSGASILSNGANALSGLQTINGVVELDNGEGLTDSAALTIKGDVFLDSFPGEGGSALTDSVSINNQGTLNLGNTNSAGGTSVSTATLTNGGVIDLTGNGNNHFSELNATSSLVNTGAFYVISDAESLTGAVSGTGAFDIWNGSSLSFAAAVGANQTVTFDNNGTLGVNATGNAFQASIAGFGTNDAIQMSNFNGAGAGWSFAENGSNTGGVLTITNGANSTHLNFAGVYSTNLFNVTGNAASNTATVGFV